MKFRDIIPVQVRMFCESVKKLWQWLPIIWKDRDWDPAYFDDILRFKLTNMANYLEKSNMYIGVEQNVKQIRFCIRILDRMRDDYEAYTHPGYKKHLEEVIFTQEYLNREQTPEEHEQMLKWFAWDKHWRERDRKLLYAVLCKYGEEFWD